MKLASADGECQNIGREILAMEQGRRNSLIQRSQVDPSQWILYERHQHLLQTKQKLKEKELEKALIKKEEIQEGYTEALKRRKVLEELKEKRESEYRLKWNRKQVNLLDEIGSRMKWEELPRVKHLEEGRG